MLRVAVNGFGRIGRAFLRSAFNRGLVGRMFDVVAVNTRSDVKINAHLFKYDSIHGKFKGDVLVRDNTLVVNGYEIKWITETDPLKLPWKELTVDIVVESTGVFRTKSDAERHLTAGAKLVVISAPAKNVDATIVMGVNDTMFDKNTMKVISLASCTTNCLAPVIKTIHGKFRILKGFMSTVHAYTSDQRILDKSHRDYRRARSAAANIIPTTTGAAIAIGKVIPELKGRLDGMSLRVPVLDGSINDITLLVEVNTTSEDVNNELRRASNDELKGIMEYTEEPLVSSDIVGNISSSIVDGKLTKVMGNLIKVDAWYDNEYGYANRVVDFVVKQAKMEMKNKFVD